MSYMLLEGEEFHKKLSSPAFFLAKSLYDCKEKNLTLKQWLETLNYGILNTDFEKLTESQEMDLSLTTMIYISFLKDKITDKKIAKYMNQLITIFHMEVLRRNGLVDIIEDGRWKVKGGLTKFTKDNQEAIQQAIDQKLK